MVKRPINGDTERLPSVVERLPHYTLIDPRLLVAGDRFFFDGKVWTVAEANDNDLYTVDDPPVHFVLS